MFCVNCGKQFDGEGLYCADCAAAMATEQETAKNPEELKTLPVYETPAEPEVFELGDAVVEPEAPKKGGKGRPIGFRLIAAVVAVAIVVSAVFFWEPLKSFFMRTVASPEDYVQHVEEKAANDMIGNVSEAYGSLLEAVTGGSNEAAKGTITLQLGEDILDVLSTAIDQSGLDLDDDVSWLSEIVFSVYSASKDDKMQVDMGIGLGKNTITTLSMLMDMAASEMFVGLPDLSEEYVFIDMEDMGLDLEPMLEAREQLAEMEDILLTEKEFNEMLNRYVQIALDAIDEAEKGSEKVEVDGLTQKLNTVSYTLTAEDILNVCIAILKEVQEDEALQGMIIGLMDEFAPDVDAEDSIEEGLEMAVESLEEALDEVDDEIVINIVTYIDNSDKIVGRTIEVEGDEMETVEISYVTVWQKNKFAFEADIAGAIEIEGAGERAKGLVNGEYEITAQGMDICTIEISGYDEDLAEDGYLKGTYIIRPDGDLIDMMLDEMGNSAVGAMLNISDPALQLSFNCDKKHTEVGFGILVDDAMLVNLIISSEETKAKDIKIPSDTVDVEDPDELLEWVEGFDFDALMKNLQKAGLPEDYLELIEDALDSI